MGQNLTLVAQFGAPTFTSLRTLGNNTVGNNLTVSGSITAQTLIVNTTSVYSGSTQFGSVIGNTHQFTGSILTSGSITVIGQYNGSGAGLTSIPNSATTATNANTANTIVTRDASGNFTAGTITATLSGNASTATSATTAGTITSQANSATITATSANTANQIVLRDGSGNFSAGTITATFSGNATTSTAVVATVTGTNSTELVRGNMADNDQFRILVGGTATNAGYVEIATADDGTEPIHVRQYTGVFSSLTRTATLLDGSGNTSFPGTVTAPTFSGALSGTASNVTTNANLTGVVTSVGNATSIANGAITNAMLANSAVANLSGTNTGDQTNISGNAATATTATYLNSAQSSTDVTNISSRINSGFFQDSATQDHTGWPSGATSWYHLISSTHSNPANYYALQFASSFFSQGVYTRNTNNDGNQAWSLIITSANISTQTVASASYATFAATAASATSATTAGSITSQANSATITATSANTANQIVLRDGSGNFSAGTITAALSGNASTATSVVATVTGTNSAELVRGNMADNDQFRILVGGTASNAGYVEIATADDGTEPIYIRQYTGVFSSLLRTATILDGSGNTTFPGTVTANSFFESSDIRFKNVIETNPNISVLGIDVIKFTRTDDNANAVRYGYSAQQVQEVIPEAVVGDEKLSVNYMDVHTLKIAALEKRIAELEAKLK
jgi:hypothetical protein